MSINYRIPYGVYLRLELHTATPDRNVIRAFYRKLSAHGRSRDRREFRRGAYAEVLKMHHEAHELYMSVMRGEIGVTG